MWLKPSFEPRQTITSSSGSSRTPNRLKYFAGHFAAEVGDAVRFAVAVVARVAGRLGQLLDDEVLAADRMGLPMPRSITSSPARRLL